MGRVHEENQVTESQIVAALEEGEAGVPIADLLRKYGISRNNWKSRYRLKRMYSELALENSSQGSAAAKTATPSAKREAASTLVTEHGLSVVRACRIVRFSRAAYYRRPVPALERDRAVIRALQGVGVSSTLAERGVHGVYSRSSSTYRRAKRRLPNAPVLAA